ncbi:MAG: TonB-dependent receptor [Chitinophagales bacterium]|nr:TonB-dependent receptor [Chitinophagales bacterium]
MQRLALFILFCFFINFSTFGQVSICGYIKINGIARPNASVKLLNTNKSILSEENGYFCFYNLTKGNYEIEAEFQGFKSEIKSLNLSEDVQNLAIEILPFILDTTNIKGKEHSELRKEYAIKADVIDLNKEVYKPVSVEQLMNRSVGVRVRNSGGLGAEADVVVGGFNGKSIKFLIDGIPIDYLGSSMGITKISNNIVDYIEIYKGILPTDIGVDALGGAVNIVTHSSDQTRNRLSYEIGSFGTHQVNINTFIRKSDKLSFGINASFNYSKNNFKVDNLPIANTTTGRTEYIKAQLFHNSYQQYNGEAFINIQNRKWADLLQFKLNTFYINRDIQNDFASRSRPFGKVFRKEYAYAIPSIRYKKNFIDNKLRTEQFLVYSHIQNELIDTAKNVKYDWLGNAYSTVSGSEMGNDLTNIKNSIIETSLDNITYRSLITYTFNTQHRLIFNAVNNHFIRVSDDLENYDSKRKIKYNRLIVGLGYQYNFMDDRISALSQIKFLTTHSQGILNNPITGDSESMKNNSGWSFSQSLKYHSYSHWLLRASFENTYRLPDQAEVFGDNSLILPNLALRPEKSLNVNLSVKYMGLEKFNFEISTYYRNVKDMIRLREINQFTSQFLNLDKVKGYGVELEALLKPVKNLEINANLTYNEFRLNGYSTLLNNEHFDKARVSNMPFYFGNAMAKYKFDNLLGNRSFIEIYWSYSYVHQFYLDFIEKQYEPDGFLGLWGSSKIYTDRIIPAQNVHSAGLLWNFKMKDKKIFSISTELDNIFNEKIFNNFKLQSAGRAYSAKVTFEI